MENSVDPEANWSVSTLFLKSNDFVWDFEKLAFLLRLLKFSRILGKITKYTIVWK